MEGQSNDNSNFPPKSTPIWITDPKDKVPSPPLVQWTQCCMAGKCFRKGKVHPQSMRCGKCGCCTKTCRNHPRFKACWLCGKKNLNESARFCDGLNICGFCARAEEQRKNDAFAQGNRFSSHENYICGCGFCVLYCDCPK